MPEMHLNPGMWAGQNAVVTALDGAPYPDVKKAMESAGFGFKRNDNRKDMLIKPDKT